VPHVGENTSIYTGNLARLQCPMSTASSNHQRKTTACTLRIDRNFTVASRGFPATARLL